MVKRKGVVTMGGGEITLVGEAIKPGDKAPDFTVVDNELKPVKLSDFKDKIKIISVFPSVDTGICASQTRRFNEEAAKLENVYVLSISVDLPFALARFCAAEGIEKNHTLSDYKNLDFGTKYGFVIEELRLLARGIIVIDKDDIVRYVEYVPEIKTHPDYESALAAVRAL